MKILVLLLMLTIISSMFTGCLDEESNPVIGTWEWSDGKGYAERYTFHANQSFQAEALGSAFIGTWEEVSPGHYQVTYWNRNDAEKAGTLTERVIYDEETDQVYFPGHRRVG